MNDQKMIKILHSRYREMLRMTKMIKIYSEIPEKKSLEIRHLTEISER